MKLYEGNQPCAGCGRTGKEKPRNSKDGLCHECREALILGRSMIKERNLERNYYRLPEFMETNITWYTIPIREIDKALRTLLRQFSQFDRDHISGHAPEKEYCICGKIDATCARDKFILPVSVYEAAKDLCNKILDAAKTLDKEKDNYKKELDEILRAQKNEIYNEGVAHGRDLLNQLNRGEITTNDIDVFIKKY